MPLDARLACQNTVRQLLGRHLQREEPDHAAIQRSLGTIWSDTSPVLLRDIECNIRRQRGFAHRGPSGQNQQVRRPEPAQLVVQIRETRGDPGKAATPVKSQVDQLGRILGRVDKTDKPALILALLSQRIELLFRLCDLLGRLDILTHIRRACLDFLADANQVPAHRQIPDRLGIVLGRHDGYRRPRQACQIVGAAQLGQAFIIRKERLQGHGIRPYAFQDTPRCALEDPPVHRVVEMVRLDNRRHAVEDLVVQQQRAQQRLLGLDIVRLKPLLCDLTAVCHHAPHVSREPRD